MKQVAITGVGAVSALGPDTASFWNTLIQGHHGFSALKLDGTTRLGFGTGAQVLDFDPEQHFPASRLYLYDRFAQFAAVAAREAVADARVSWTPELRAGAAVVTGSCVGGQQTLDDGFVNLYARGRPRVHPVTIPRVMSSAGASLISMDMGLKGPVYTVSSACASASHAIGQAAWLVRSGASELAIAGGSEAPFGFGNLKAWDSMRVVARETCRPFSRDRDGMVLGEGGAMMVLEPLDAARERGARVYAELAGFGMCADAHHITRPSPDGAARAMLAALRDAGVQPEQVGYVNTHGTGTPSNDEMETRAIRDVFGAGADRLAVSSTKSMHGHALGAAGALEGIATALAIHHGMLPPTANYREADPACDLDVVPNSARQVEVACALSNSFAFGGLNAVLAMRAVDG